MRMIAPKFDAPQITIAEDQEEYKPVTAAQVRHPTFGCAPGRSHNALVLCFRPSAQERERIMRGEDVYISLLTFGGPMQPIIVCVGAEEAAGIFNVAVTT